MHTSIYRHELQARLRSVLVWSLALAGFILAYFAMYPVFAEQAALMNEMLARFPPELMAAFGLGQLDLATVLGFYSFVFLFAQLCLAIQAGNYGFGLVSIEESELTADFLLTRPVSRPRILTSKLLAALTSLLLTDVVVWVSSFAALALFSDGRPYTTGPLLLLLSSLPLFQLFFLSVGLIVSLLVKRVGSVTPYSLGLGFGAYILSGFSGIFGEVALEYLTPFKHFDPAYIVAQAAYNTPLVLLNVAVSVVALAASYWLYVRRDIHAVS